MRQQLALFKQQQINVSDLTELAKTAPFEAYKELRRRGLEKHTSILFIVNLNFQSVFDEDEMVLTFLNIELGDNIIECYEAEMEVFIKTKYRKTKIYSLSEDEPEEFNDAYVKKIKKLLNQFIANNAYQFDLD